MSFDEICRQLYAIGGIDRCGQSAFCLLFVIYMKAYELGSFTYAITNKELMHKAGFATRQNYLKVRNGLESDGYIEIETTENKRIIKIQLNINLIGLSVDSQLTKSCQTVDRELTNSLQEVDEREKVISVDKELTDSCQTVDKELTNSLQEVDEREKVTSVDKELTGSCQENDNPLQGLIKTFTRS